MSTLEERPPGTAESQGAALTPEPDLLWASRFRRISRVASVLVIALGSLILLGWVFDIAVLKRVHPSFVTMKANTAILFVLTGSSLWCLARGVAARVRRGLGLAVAVAAGLTLAQYLFGVDLGIDELVVHDDELGRNLPGRMAPVTAVNFLLLGSGLALRGTGRQLQVAQGGALLATVSSLVSFCGYLYSVEALYSWFAYATIAVHTTVGFLLSCGAFLLARPAVGVMTVAASDTNAGILARRLLPTITLLPIGIGWILRRGELAGYYDTTFVVGFMALSTVILLAVLVWVIAASLHRSEISRREVLAELREREQDLATTLASIGDGVISTDVTGRVTKMNPVAEQLTGWTASEARGKPLQEVFRILSEDTRELVESPAERVLREGGLVELANRSVLVSRDGSERPIADSGAPIRDPDDVVRGVVLVFRDVQGERASQAGLEASLRRFRALVEASAQIVWTTDARGMPVDDSPSWRAFTGQTYDEWKGFGWLDAFHPEDRERTATLWKSAVETKTPLEMEYRIRHVSGEWRWTTVRALPIVSGDGTVLGWVGMNTDITERKQAEQERERLLSEVSELSKGLERRIEERTRELSVAKERLNGIISIAADAIVSIDGDQRITMFNKGAEEIFGWDQEEVLGQPLDILIPERLRGIHREHVAGFAREPVKARRMAERRAVFGLRKNGEEFPAEAAISKLTTQSGDVFTIILQDITERRRLEADILESRNFLQNVLDSSTEYTIIATDLERRIQSWNIGAQRLYGYAPEEIVDRSSDILDLADDVRDGRVEALHLEARRHGSAQGVFRHRRKDGSDFLVRSVVTCRRNARGEHIGYLRISRDVSLEEKLLDEQAFFARIGQILVSTLELEEIVTRVAEASVPYLGDLCAILLAHEKSARLELAHTSSEMRPIIEALKQYQLPRQSMTWRAYESRQPIIVPELPRGYLEALATDAEHLRLLQALSPKSGMCVPLLAHGRCHGAISVHSRDASRRYGPDEQRSLEELARQIGIAVDNALLRERVQLEAAITAHLAEGVYLIRTSDETIVYANRQFERMFGYEPGELVGKHVSVVNAPDSGVSPQQRAMEIMSDLRRVGLWYGELENLRKDGTRFWCFASVSTFRYPLYGDVWISVHTDITERKAFEQERTRALRERETLLKEIHHRVKNNLQVISSLFYLQGQRAEAEPIRKLLDESRNRIQSIALIHEKLYQSEQLASIDFGDYLQGLTRNLASAIGSRAPQVKIVIDARSIFLDVERAIPCALIVNELVTNSMKHAFPDGRSGEIRVSVCPAEAKDLLELEVSDNGVGFPATFEVRTSTTLGMQLVSSLTKQLRGTLELGREGGATVRIRFPAPPPIQESPLVKSQPQDLARALIVDG